MKKNKNAQAMVALRNKKYDKAWRIENAKKANLAAQKVRKIGQFKA